RNDLIRSGLELLTQNGFLATGVDAIVKNANVPKGSFYYYLKSKEDYAVNDG
ncbi:TPA: TetR/AcrR family transcriptional regulator, partial [Escherichia coli]|nr:TetR/AcrR family transcriptional regulator [Escherichia coli]